MQQAEDHKFISFNIWFKLLFLLWCGHINWFSITETTQNGILVIPWGDRAIEKVVPNYEK